MARHTANDGWMMMRAVVAASLLICTIVSSIALTTTVQAGACAESAVSARGEESRFVWMAKTKARANWRRKVRSMPGIGPSYANWARAENTEERCMTGPSGTVCIFTGTPCLP